MKLRFSVITPSLNCKDHILTNIQSVQKQGLSPDELEHWIIDGGSTDGTVELLKTQKNIQWISEPDRGLSDAVNKGIQRAKGEWILWVNADDYLAEDACATFLSYVKKYPNIRVFAGDETVLRYDGSFEQTVKGWDYNLEELLGCRTGINQASTFVHRSVYEKTGLLDVNDRFTMDYEWTVRAMHHFRCQPIPHVLSFYRRRKGSIIDAGMVHQIKGFLRLRHQYKKPRLSRADLRIYFYLWTDCLRQIRWVRKAVRWIKTLFGQQPLHPD